MMLENDVSGQGQGPRIDLLSWWHIRLLIFFPSTFSKNIYFNKHKFCFKHMNTFKPRNTFPKSMNNL